MSESYTVTTVITPEKEIYLPALKKLSEVFNVVPKTKENGAGTMYIFGFKTIAEKEDFYKELNKTVPVI